MNVARPDRARGLPKYGVRAEPLLFFRKQRIDEVGLRSHAASPHQLSQTRFCDTDRDPSLGHGVVPRMTIDKNCNTLCRQVWQSAIEP